jgi:hypothetical protein
MNKALVGNVVEQAVKVTSFRKSIREVCRKAKLEYPTDEKVAEWIEQGYPFNVEDFIADYREHKGIFRTPLADFRAAVNNNFIWGDMPSEDEIQAFFNKYGNNISLFCKQHTIKNMKPLERKVYLKTIEVLPTDGLAALWNRFIEESAHFGEDSYIYDLENPKDIEFLLDHMEGCEFQTIKNMNEQKVRYVQWFALNDKSIQGITDDNIQYMITAYWSEIFERIMIFPSCYQRLMGKQWGIEYFDEIVWPIITKELGIEICTETNEIKYCK